MFLSKIPDISARKGAKFNKFISEFWQKVISLVTMATNVDSKLLTIVFVFLSGTEHSVKVSSNSESVRAGALLEFFGGYRELMLTFILATLLQCQTVWIQSRTNVLSVLIWVQTI